MLKLVLVIMMSILAMRVNSQCVSFASNIDYMTTGVMELGLPTSNIANENYNVIFESSVNLGSYANLFYAFGIAGLQTPSGQNFYSVEVSQVYFTNSNSAMNVFLDYFNSVRTEKTQWTRIKLTYIVVSPQFEGISTGGYAGNSYVWANSVTLTPPQNDDPVDSNTLFSHPNTTPNECGYIDSFPPIFGTNCPADAKVIFHYYIMGFKYDSTIDSTYQFRASVQGGDGVSNDQSDFTALIASGIIPNGPRMTISDFSGQLDSIKIGIVITVLRDYLTYPIQNSNPQLFKYSGIYMPITSFNTAVSVSSQTTSNLNYFDIGLSNYKMYGFSSFQLVAGSQIQFDLELRDLYSVILSTGNTLNSVQISGDMFTSDINGVCNSTLIEQIQVQRQIYSSNPSLTTNQQSILKLTSSNGILADTGSEYVFHITGYDIGSDSSAITFMMEITYNNLVAGRAYTIQTAFNELGATDLPTGLSVRYSVTVDGVAVFLDQIIMTTSQDDSINKLGRTIAGTSTTILLTVVFDRSPTVDIDFHMNLALFEISGIFDPINQCCASSCPASTGINLNTSPISCVSCDQSTGQFFNSATNQCQCISGYYQVSTVTQSCFPCSGSLCSQCLSSSPSRCLTCVIGAQLSLIQTCSCANGLIQANGECTACDYRCATCSVSNQCSSCSDSNRDILNSCNCQDSYYDNGQSICQTCPNNCATCSSSTICTSCDSTANKILSNNLCVCMLGFYSSFNTTSGTTSCLPCNPICDSCTSSPQNCTTCNTTQHKVPAIDSNGQRTCLCASGYFLDSDGSCIQTDCLTDPFCAECSTNGGLRICLACTTASNRQLDTISFTCNCKQGTYENSALQCVSCPTACSTCTNSTFCPTCVVGADRVGNMCSCSNGLVFVTTPIRYCKSCENNCLSCLSNGLCVSCVPGYQLTVDSRCVCSLGRYIDSVSGQCLDCLFDCDTCTNGTECTTCRNNLLLQNNSCVSRCDLGFYLSGSTCQPCAEGCRFCQNPNSCLQCNSGLYEFNGVCFQNCPQGTVLELGTGSCIACNSPCRTCTIHPSRCTSCEVNFGSLFEADCFTSCPSGTYASNAICQFCDFSCASCIGQSRVCTSCPANKFLFNNACLDFCPGLTVNGQCSTSCLPGFYQSSASACSPCPSICEECINQTQCTICASTAFSYNGDCLVNCPSNTFISNNKVCFDCDESCSGCTINQFNCIQCSSGYFRQAGRCVLSATQCLSNQYRSVSGLCMNCKPECQTCSNVNFCTSCFNQTIPVNGQCINIQTCSDNCFNCESSSVCISCDIGFNLYQSRCVRTCPFPFNSINGKCECGQNQIFFQNNCLSSCPSGFTALSGVCQQCSSNCVECSQSVRFCTSCAQGLILNVTSRICEQTLEPETCPLGQYFENRICQRFCPINTVYQNGLCYQNCFEGYLDNGQGGCQFQDSPLTNCFAPLFLYQGNCVVQCPNGFYESLNNRTCEGCSFQCLTCININSCTNCVSNYRLTNGVCVEIVQTNCGIGTYFNGTFGQCRACISPCENCIDINQCTSCVVGYSLVLGQCLRRFTNCQNGQFRANNGECLSCIFPCTSCSSISLCTSCANGYDLSQNGQCILQTANLIELTGIQVQSSYLRQNSIIASLVLPTVPNPLNNIQQSQFFNVKQNTRNVRIISINQWQDSFDRKRIWVSVNFQLITGSSFLFLSVNASVLSQSYAQLGYFINEQAYKAISVYATLQSPPASIQVPADSPAIPYVSSNL